MLLTRSRYEKGSDERAPVRPVERRREEREKGAQMFYCPKCAAQNSEGARYCRACGADVHLVPAAMTGRLPEQLASAGESAPVVPAPHWQRKGKVPTFEDGIRAIIAGLGFIFVSAGIGLFAPAGRIWFFWLLIPAFFFLSDGISQLLGARRRQNELSHLAAHPAELAPPAHTVPLFEPAPARQTGEILPPASITEGTTRHLDAMETPRGEATGERSRES